uniref:ATP binding cassette subfamily A member 8 n=1 Tax=Oryctolagus cuniculus TaxID=9986 RepID=A0A5F9DU75_RABIT
MVKREISVCQQTWALLWKNLLNKKRMKRNTFMECFYSLLILLMLYVFPNSHEINDFSSLSTVDLGRIDSFNDSSYVVAYTPFTNTTQRIMSKFSSASFMTGREVMALPDEENITEIISHHYGDVVEVIFTNTHSYNLKFMRGYRMPNMKEHQDHLAHCHKTEDMIVCEATYFWTKGFVAFQAAINAAIIEITTNHSVMEELMSVTGKYMKIDLFISQGGILTDFYILTCIICFSPLTYYASLGVTRERKKMKGFMTMMGLRNLAFWLSWGVLYAGYVFILALCLTFIIKSVQFVILPNFMVVFLLFLFYGLSLIALTFLMSVLVKKSFLTGLVVFLLTVVWGSLGFTALYRQLPASLEWILSLFSPFAFTLGMTQLLHMDYDLNSNADSMSDSNIIILTIFMLFFDSFLYLTLMFYFEKILPNEYGRRRSPLFFLKCSFSSQQNTADHEVLENEIEYDSSNDSFEPISPEFHGKEAIRIRNITKEYIGKPKRIEALKDLVFDIYEGQITAILGHSGAGKSTLINILNGLCVPTKGSITIYNHKLSEMDDLENIYKLIGVCPQCNVQFDFLTVRENLRLFAKIKGIHPHEVDNEVKRVLLELEMKNIQDILAQNLSGGQKRKLTFGIAILGDPQIFLLDEPTAGLDPLSRHRVWSFLKERKTDHVILFSTQFMDEADILADRKVFLSKGKLKCAGSSLFLKKKWGIGYHLSLQLNETCAPERITSLIKQHIPEAKLLAESEGKLICTLPLERTNKFPDLYKDLENCPDLGIESYGVSMTTLNEVFLKLEGKSAFDQSVLPFVDVVGLQDTGRLAEMEQLVSSLNEMRKTTGGMALWLQQVYAIARVRFLNLKHERKSNARKILRQDDYCWEISPHLYFLAPGQEPHGPFTNLLIINKTGKSIDDFIRSVAQQNIALEVDAFGTRNGTDDSSYNGAIIVSGDEKVCWASVILGLSDFCSKICISYCNTNEIHKSYLLCSLSSLHYSHFQENAQEQLESVAFLISWLLLMCSFPPYISMTSNNDFKNKAQSQLWVSGLYPSAYWFGQTLVEVPIYFSLIIFMYIVYYILKLQEGIFKTLYVVGYAISLTFLTYVISFIFRKGRKNSGIWSFCFFLITLFSTFFMLINGLENALLFYISTLIPSATLIGCTVLHYVVRNPFLHFIIFVFILRCLECKLGKKTMRKDPIFRISPRSSEAHQNPENLEGEDEDVQMERARTANALTSPNLEEKPVIIASCLRKEYAYKKKCFSKKKKKIATRNISFCVRKGEILGLLGHNGAGKSTSIKMITGDTKPSAGQVLLKGSSRGDTLGFLGYCPQEDALWPSLTVRQHLEVFAAVKGLKKAEANIAISRLADALKLQDQLKAPVLSLQLCFALSILGSPSVVLLDEPSTGMDPEGQQQMWQAIRATFRNTERGAILTTHYMSEAEAVCDRVAIMVSGRLRCIGSIQHLKSKFGKEYLLEMKLKMPEQREPLHAEILRLFPQAARQERYYSLMVYKLPVEDVQPLSQAFFKLETAKQSFDLEEYSLSQSTLEQVFLELSKEQELDDLDGELDPSVKRKLLPQEEP